MDVNSCLSILKLDFFIVVTQKMDLRNFATQVAKKNVQIKPESFKKMTISFPF